MLVETEVKIIMLTCDNSFYKSGLYSNGKILTKHHTTDNKCRQQALYFILKEELKRGDWYYNSITKEIKQKIWADDIIIIDGDILSKIVATIDPTLVMCSGIKRYGEGCTLNNNCKYPNCRMASPSQEFMNYYVKLGGIDKVNVIYEYKVKSENELNMEEDPFTNKSNLILKVNSDNIITTNFIKKSNWSKEKTVQKIQSFRLYALKFGLEANVTNNWIEKNL